MHDLPPLFPGEPAEPTEPIPVIDPAAPTEPIPSTVVPETKQAVAQPRTDRARAETSDALTLF
jgi:hypothetical protein